MNARPVPAALAKRGITRAVDNLPAGASLRFAPGEFLRIFRADIEARLPDLSPCRHAQADFQEVQP